MLTIYLTDQEDYQMRHDPRGVDAWLDDLLKREQRQPRLGVDEPVHTVVTKDVGEVRARVVVSREAPKAE